MRPNPPTTTSSRSAGLHCKIAYFFDFDYADGRQPNGYMEPLHRAVASWWRAALPPDDHQLRLEATWMAPDEVIVQDFRPCAAEPRLHLSGVAAQVLAACDQASSLSKIARHLGGMAADHTILSCLRDFSGRGHVVEMEGLFLTLAVMRNRPAMMGERVRDEDIRSDAAAAADPLLRPV